MLKQLLKTFRFGATANGPAGAAEVRHLLRQSKFDDARQMIGKLPTETTELLALRACLLGELAFRRRDDDEAERQFREALKLAPGLCDAHHGLSLILHAQDRLSDALVHSQFAANQGSDARFSAQLGLCQLALGNHVQADIALTRATRLDQDDAYAWNNLGITRRARNDLHGARAAFLQALELDASFDQAAANLGHIETDLAAAATDIRSTGASPPADLTLAIDDAESRCVERPDDAEAAIALFKLYEQAADIQSGIDALEAYRARNRNEHTALAALACAYVKAGEHERGLPMLLDTIERDPANPDLLMALVEIRRDQGRHAEALELMARVMEVGTTVERRGHLASLLINACRFREALDTIDGIVREEPDRELELVGLKIHALTYLGRHDEAMPLLDAAVEQSPHEPNRRFPRATIHLLNERFDAGWDDYAFRHLSSTKHLRVLAFPQWRGEPLLGKSVLVLAEQGLGDQVMFASCLPDLLALQPRRLIVEAVNRIAATLARSFPSCEVIATRQDSDFDWIPAIGEVDYHIALGDLPRLLRRERSDFPQHPGYLIAAADRIAHWRQRLQGPIAGAPRIGFSWRGGTEMTRSGMRTMDIGQFASLMKRHTANWVCVQYGDVDADLKRPELAGLSVQYARESIADLDEFAALIAGLDLVITVCNTTVHYAGALDRPVWVMAPQIPEWRYGLSFDVMPWYPSSRMFRQETDGDWAGLIDRIDRELSRWLRPRNVTLPIP